MTAVATKTKLLVELERDLLNSAQAILGQPSLAATIREALRRVVAQHARSRVLEYLATADDDQVEALGAVRERNW